MSITPSSDYIIPKLKAETIVSLIRKGVRASGRGLEDFRELDIVTNYIPNADGSAFVKLGNTQVIAGVKLELGTPYPDTPNEGAIVVSAEFVPAASPLFEPGPPDENAIELARVIDRSLREIKAIDLGKLVLIPGKRVWVVWIDIYVLDHDGNLIDASSIATLVALLTARVPKAEVEGEEIRVGKSEYTGPLPMNRKVVTVTIGKIDKIMLVDPDIEEETVLDTKLVIAVSDDERIAGLQKSGMGALDKNEVLKMTELAMKKGKEIIEIVEKSIEASTRGASTEQTARKSREDSEDTDMKGENEEETSQ
ncbi:MAG: exosome complex protein Rrp42 [Desulfurococcales archaeon]|nr:exosome complex protein Rrp42 [Desulfurococcales archaeon]